MKGLFKRQSDIKEFPEVIELRTNPFSAGQFTGKQYQIIFVSHLQDVC